MTGQDADAAYRRLRLSHDLTAAIGASPGVAEALSATLRLFCGAGGWVVGQVWVPDADGDALVCAPVWFQVEPEFEEFRVASAKMRFRRGEGLVGSVWESAEVAWVERITADAAAYRRADVAASVDLSTALLVPVVSDGHVKAVLEFLTRGQRVDEPGLRDSIGAAAAQLGSLIAQKEAETELRHSEARFRAVAESAHDAIVSIDSGGVITFVNSQALTLLKQTQGELMGAPVTDMIPERFHHAHWAGLDHFLATGEARLIGTTVAVFARRSDGSEVPVELSLSTWEVEGSRNFTAIIRDVSERQRMQSELERALAFEREAADKLRELDDLKNTFLDAVSHDLRTPLSAIRAATLVLRRDADSPMLTEEERRRYLLGVEASANKIRALLDDLLDLERLTSGEVILKREPVALAELLQRSVADHRAALERRTVELNLEPVIAEVDAAKVERILENLLLNAARHTPVDTVVWVSVQREESGALLCVDDSGPGVPESLRGAVFERFRQVPRGLDSGLGIGLSLVARLAEAHGGRAWVQERPGGGASFRVLLPLSADQPATAAAHV